jgi:hypothetical protein
VRLESGLVERTCHAIPAPFQSALRALPGSSVSARQSENFYLTVVGTALQLQPSND